MKRAFVLGVGVAAAWLIGCGSDVVVFGDDPEGGAGGTTTPSGTGTGVGTGGSSGGTGGVASGGSAGSGNVGGAPMCVDDAMCPSTPCGLGSCVQGVCELALSPAGSACVSNTGFAGVCDDLGACLVGAGGPCGSAVDCASGFCTDGVCCEGACDGVCETCDAVPGVCTPAAVGTDPDGDCASGACDGSGMCVVGPLLWSNDSTSSGDVYAVDVAVDGSGNVIVVGQFTGTADFGGGSVTSAGGFDVFVAKYDPTGALLWVETYGNFQSQYAWGGVDVDAAGNIVIAGYFFGSIQFGSATHNSAGQRDVFLAKLDPNGNAIWSDRFGNFQNQYVRDVDVSPNGDIAMAGYFSGNIDFGTGALSSSGQEDLFVARFDGNGTVISAVRAGDNGDQRAYGVAIDQLSGDTIVVGRFYDTIDLGGGVITSAGGRDIVVARLTAAGGHVWTNQYGDNSDQFARAVAVDPSGAIWLTGYVYGGVDFGGGLEFSAGGADAFIVKLNSNGDYLTGGRFGDAEDQFGEGVAVATNGDVALAGHVAGTVDIGTGPLSSAGGEDAFFAKWSSNGQPIFAKIAGDGDDQLGWDVAFDGMGNLFAVGYFDGDLDLGAGVLGNGGGIDSFVGKYGP